MGFGGKKFSCKVEVLLSSLPRYRHPSPPSTGQLHDSLQYSECGHMYLAQTKLLGTNDKQIMVWKQAPPAG